MIFTFRQVQQKCHIDSRNQGGLKSEIYQKCKALVVAQQVVVCTLQI